MYEQPFERTPCNNPAEEKMMKRLYRLLDCVQSVQESTWRKQPRLSRDLHGFYWILARAVNGIESQILNPGRLRTWMDEQAQSKAPTPSKRLLIHLLRIARQATAEVRATHNVLATEDDERRESCVCFLCEDVIDLKWLLGKAYRLLDASEITKGVPS